MEQVTIHQLIGKIACHSPTILRSCVLQMNEATLKYLIKEFKNMYSEINSMYKDHKFYLHNARLAGVPIEIIQTVPGSVIVLLDTENKDVIDVFEISMPTLVEEMVANTDVKRYSELRRKAQEMGLVK